MERIKHSVGQGGWNFPNDVAIVQALLNRHRPSTRPLLAVDKVAGGLTVEAIKEFQKRVVNLPHPDGRIDPTGLTAEFLYTSPTWLSVQGTVKYLNTLVASVASGASSMLPINMFSQHNKIAWGAKVKPEFKFKVIKICKNLDIEPDHLMTCMAFETDETFSPSKKNGAGSSGTGLIQFMKDTALDIETTVEKLAAMSDIQQLDYVEEYFKRRIKRYKKLSTLEDVYFAILQPIGIHQADNFVIFKDGTGNKRKQEEYDKNKGLDKNKDGKIPIAEVAVRIRAMYKKGISQGYLG